MNDNFIIILFKNKIKKKIINKFKTEKKAIEFYNNLLAISEETKFCRRYENGKESLYELGLLEKSQKSKTPVYVRDDIGRQIKVKLEDENYSIKKINLYCIEELILDYETKEKINVQQFIKKYLNKEGFKLLSKLNNKIIFQNDDYYRVFTLKNSYDSDRLIDVLSKIFLNDKRGDVLFVKDYDTSQRKYLYSILESKGISKKYLFRSSTTHLQ